MIGTQPAAPPAPWRPAWAVLGPGNGTYGGPAPCPGVVWTAGAAYPARAWLACSLPVDHDGRCRP